MAKRRVLRSAVAVALVAGVVHDEGAVLVGVRVADVAVVLYCASVDRLLAHRVPPNLVRRFERAALPVDVPRPEVRFALAALREPWGDDLVWGGALLQ